ncbi:hypothetical protein ACFV27_00610 [Streptomyces antimycoticus]|uniref:hypothetical protein n=1 Tax=Streptomyces antimycoticus TaxID=68175 RepID=UPI0036A08756
MTGVSYERVARAFQDGDPRELSDRDLAARFGCEEEFVARVRREAGYPRFVGRSRSLWERAEAKVRELSRPVDDGHQEWTGPVSRDGVPVVRVPGLCTTVGRVAFQMANGRPPEGNVKPRCTLARCVAPGHQTDRPIRAALRAPLAGVAA